MQPIATAKFFIGAAKGPRKSVEFKVFAPEPDPRSKFGDYRCKVHAKGLGRPIFVGGLNALQALGLSLRVFRAEVELLKSKKINLYYSKSDKEPAEFLFSYFGDLKDAPPDLKRGIRKAKRLANKSRDS